MLESAPFTLTAHPDSPNPAVHGIEGSILRADGVLKVAWRLRGALDCLRIPDWTRQRRGERLWEHTCFEVFVRVNGAGSHFSAPVSGSARAAKTGPDPVCSYHELNFSPSGAWAAYAFARYREAAPSASPPVEPHIAVRLSAAALELEASLELGALDEDYRDAPLAFAVSAVIEDAEGALSYWALAHPPGKPDFHHAGAFALTCPSARFPE